MFRAIFFSTLCSIFIFLSSCEEPIPVPPPGIVQEFSCKINGKPFHGHTFQNVLFYERYYDHPIPAKRMEVRAINEAEDSMLVLVFGIDPAIDTSHRCMEVNHIYTQRQPYRYNDVAYTTITTGRRTIGNALVGQVFVATCDEETHLISGSFETKGLPGLGGADTLRFTDGIFNDIFYTLKER